MIVAILVSFGQEDVPVTIYLNVELVAPAAGVNVEPVKVPPVPVNRVQAPPVCSPVIKLKRLTAVVELSQMVVEPSAPALGAFETVTV